MKVIQGDLTALAKQNKFNAIIHGCNCFNTMNSGIAKQIKAHFRQAWLVDRSSMNGDVNKLGTFTSAIEMINHQPLIVFNAYTQFGFGTDRRHVDYDAVKNCFEAIANFLEFEANEIRIGYPKIGAGLGGGDWRIISEIIDDQLQGFDHTLVEYAPNK